MRSRSLLLLAALAVALPTFGSVANGAHASGLTDRASVEDHLVSIGIDPAAVTWQESANNYAGPDCPGGTWSCATTAQPVVQIGSTQNVFECTGASGPGNQCLVVQVSDGGVNVSVCRLGSTANPVTQTCSITQSNTTGGNSATVEQTASQSVRSNSKDDVVVDQSIVQDASIDQASTSGMNVAIVDQVATQAARVGAAPRNVGVTQEIHQDLHLDQESGSGNNDADVVQSQRQDARAESKIAGDVTVHQNADGTEGRNANVVLFQRADSGDNDATVAQSIAQDARGDSARHLTQVQGSQEGGSEAYIDPDSNSGTSHYDADQDEVQVAKGDPGPSGTLTRSQHGPNMCCIIGNISRTPDTCTITQDSSQDGKHGEQTNVMRARAFAKQNCTAQQTVVQNGQTTTNDASGTFFDETIDCSGECQTTESSPNSQVRADVANVSQEDFTFEPSTTASPGDIIEIQLTYENTGNATASDVIVSDVVPPQTWVWSCECTMLGEGGPGETVSFSLGNVEPGIPETVSYLVSVDEGGFPVGTTPLSDQPSASSVEEGTVAGTAATIQVIVPENAEVVAHLALVNTSGGGTYGAGYATPSSTTAQAEDVIEYRVTLENTGNVAVSDFEIVIPFPSDSTFANYCTPGDGCQYEPATQPYTNVRFDRSWLTLQPGEIRQDYVRIVVGTQDGSTSATVTSPNIADVTSNAAHYFQPQVV